jgi:hypothetical protein
MKDSAGAKTRICEKCKTPTAPEDMARYPSGGMKKCCKNCNKPRAAASAPETRRAAKKAAPAAEVVPPPDRLEIAGGYGLRAELDEDMLKIEQDDREGNTDTVLISRSEFALLAGKYSDWAAGR